MNAAIDLNSLTTEQLQELANSAATAAAERQKAEQAERERLAREAEKKRQWEAVQARAKAEKEENAARLLSIGESATMAANNIKMHHNERKLVLPATHIFVMRQEGSHVWFYLKNNSTHAMTSLANISVADRLPTKRIEMQSNCTASKHKYFTERKGGEGYNIELMATILFRLAEDKLEDMRAISIKTNNAAHAENMAIRLGLKHMSMFKASKWRDSTNSEQVAKVGHLLFDTCIEVTHEQADLLADYMKSIGIQLH